jgi:transcriptional regulator with XRE-family HTH domain
MTRARKNLVLPEKPAVSGGSQRAKPGDAAASANGALTWDREHLGRTLRKLRRDRHLSLADVASATGISRSFLALVETAKSDLTIGRLMVIMKFYGITFGDLVPEATPNPVIARRNDQQHVPSPGEGIDYWLLTPAANRLLMPLILEFELGAASAEFHRHEGEEVIHVLEGEIILEFEGEDAVTLRQGDSAYYSSELGHRFKNVGRKRARVFAVGTPPSL